MPPSTTPSSLKPQKLFSDSTTTTTPGIKPTMKNSKGNNAPATERKTHIEVCARIRPLQISMQSSSSYFHSRTPGLAGSSAHGASSPQAITTPARKPQVPKRGSITPPTTAKSKKKGDEPTPLASSPSEDDLFYAWDVMGNDTATQSPKTDIVPGRTHQYTLDKVYSPTTTTKEMYNKSVKQLVNSAMEGYHSAVLAYGQTSTGKTFSMTGTPTSPGIIPLAIHQCFQCLEKNREYLIRVSYLEVYKEQIRDLLADGVSQIRLFDHREQGLIIKGLREEVVTCPKQIFEILAQGEKRRKIGATNMNQHSSRSHVMVRLWIESRAVAGSAAADGKRNNFMNNNSNNKNGTAVRVSSLSLVDLAGSESVKLHGANEARRQEGHYINKSLMALGKVVYALSEKGKQNGNKINTAPQHIPYRDSKLTRLLQPSLSGNAQMVLICCISPLATHVEESHNTFKFATRAKKVPQKATIQESVDEKTLLQTYREEIEALKQQLRDAKNQQEKLLKAQKEQEVEIVTAEDDDIDDEVQELKLAIRNMEHLILKSKATTPPATPSMRTALSEDELIDSVDDADDDNREEEALLALMTETQKSSGSTRSPMSKSPPQTPSRTSVGANNNNNNKADTSADMHHELHRIQGLLGSVLKKRSRTPKSPIPPNGGAASAAAASTTTPLKRVSSGKQAEVNQLRAQLEEQEVASSLKAADASFLQKQLEEKDNLLAEVSKILEQVETRQIELEAENEALKRQVAALKAKNGGVSPTIRNTLSMDSSTTNHTDC